MSDGKQSDPTGRTLVKSFCLCSNASLLAGYMSIGRFQNEARLQAAVRERSLRSRNVDSNQESDLNRSYRTTMGNVEALTTVKRKHDHTGIGSLHKPQKRQQVK